MAACPASLLGGWVAEWVADWVAGWEGGFVGGWAVGECVCVLWQSWKGSQVCMHSRARTTCALYPKDRMSGCLHRVISCYLQRARPLTSVAILGLLSSPYMVKSCYSVAHRWWPKWSTDQLHPTASRMHRGVTAHSLLWQCSLLV